MSYVGGDFEHDLFVSYSHGGDGDGHGLLQPWSLAFVAELQKELRTEGRFRRDLKVFIDASHRPGEGVDPLAGLTPQLEAQIAGAAILVVLMSPDYLESTWCARERDWWCGAQSGRGLPTDRRIAVVRILPTTEKWPPALCDPQGEPLVGFPFHGDVRGVTRPLGWIDLPGPFGREFREALLAVVGSLFTGLDGMKERVAALCKARDEAHKLQQSGGQAVYLHGRKVQQERWEQVALALADGGYSVLPGEPDPVAPDAQAWQELRARRVETLADCDALLLLGAGDGRLLDSDLIAVGRHDRQSARARSQRPLPCGVFDTVGVPIATPIRKATARNIQADWLDATQDKWVPCVHDWLAEKGAEAERRL